MKKMLLATALAPLITGCAQQIYCSKQTRKKGTKGNHHPSFFYFGISKKTVDAAKICGGRNAVKTETQQRPVNGLARFYYFRHLYSAGSACIAHNIA